MEGQFLIRRRSFGSVVWFVLFVAGFAVLSCDLLDEERDRDGGLFPGGDSDGDTDTDTDTDADEVLDHNYLGVLSLHFTNADLPPIDETGCVNVAVNKFGEMTFSPGDGCTGELSYDETDDNGALKIQRNGTITLDPIGSYNPDNSHFEIDENTTVDETMTTWVWMGYWGMEQNMDADDTWHGGYAFPFADATADGSTVGYTGETGSANWTLTLIPTLTD